MSNLDTPLSALNLPRTFKTSLNEAGYKTFGHLTQVSASDLGTELGVSLFQAGELLKQIETFDPNTAQHLNGASHTSSIAGSSYSQPIIHSTAADLLSTATLHRFSTQSTSLDTLISAYHPVSGCSYTGGSARWRGKEKEGAIVPGMTVEVSGPPGGGKTAVAIGIILSARMPMSYHDGDRENGGTVIAGEVLVIDTEGAITAERLHDAAEILTRTTSISPVNVVRGIHLVRIATQIQMIAFLHTLDDWLEQHPKVNLVVIDTLSYHFRQPGLDMHARRRIMDLVKHKFGKATTVHRCAVVLTNQLATKLMTADNKPANFDTGDRAVLMPQLGDFWTTGKTLRMVLFRGTQGDELRYAHASMAGSNKDIPWACFDIDSEGIPCDVPESLYKPLSDEVS